MPSSTCALRRTPATLPANVRTVTCWPSRSSRTVFSIVAKAVVATARVAMTTANKARARGERRTLLRTDRDGQLPRTSTLCARNLSDKRHLLRGRDRWDGWDDAALMSDLLHPRRCGIRRHVERSCYQPKTRAAVAVTAAATSSGLSPRTCASARTVSGTRYGAFGRPR